MKIDIQTPDNVNLTDHLESVVKDKVQKLEKFYQNIMDCIVYLHDNGNSVNDKEVEIKLIVKENTLFCQEKESSFEKAVDLAVEAMRKQLQKYKDKKRAK